MASRVPPHPFVVGHHPHPNLQSLGAIPGRTSVGTASGAFHHIFNSLGSHPGDVPPLVVGSGPTHVQAIHHVTHHEHVAGHADVHQHVEEHGHVPTPAGHEPADLLAEDPNFLSGRTGVAQLFGAMHHYGPGALDHFLKTPLPAYAAHHPHLAGLTHLFYPFTVGGSGALGTRH